MKKIFLLTTVLMLAPALSFAAGGFEGSSGDDNSSGGGSSNSGGNSSSSRDGDDGGNGGSASNAGTKVSCPTGRVAVNGTVAVDDSGLRVVSVQKLFKKESYLLGDQTAEIGRKVTACVIPGTQQSMTTDEVYENVRKLARSGEYDHALTLLAMAPDQEDPRILTYYGFTNRMLGKTGLATVYYVKAINLDPTNVLARSYYGQSLAQRGHMEAAKAQLQAIAEVSGTDNWPYESLAAVINGAEPYRF